MLTDRKLEEGPGIFLEGGSMSLLEASSQVRQLLAAQYPFNLEDSPAAAPEEAASIDVLFDDLDGKPDC